jgi:ABC-type antimicrobial peptide transport system ATPase subunit
VPALLEVRDLTVHYATGNEPAVVVNNLSLDVEEGEVVGLLGESGCGKTTLLLAILGLLPSSARVVMGSIRFRGRDLRALGKDELRGLRGEEVSIVFQEPALALNPVLRVGVSRWPRSLAPTALGAGHAAGRRRWPYSRPSDSRSLSGSTIPIPTSSAAGSSSGW